MSTKTTSNRETSSQQSWLGHTHIATFIRCLHLLDLDLLEDWPGITEQLFAAKTAQQTLQQRVKAVEWSLYRLFEIYDPDETKDKLRPFFPPTAPLQSLNLRAALYRCLTELKKNGVLGKDALLRKTMLDDCKGDRFDEVMSSFAVSVLRRATIVPNTINTNRLSESQLVALAIAYKVSLKHNLQKRKNEDERAKLELKRLDLAEANLQERLEQSKVVTTRIDVGKQQELQSLVDSNWIGNSAWADILLRGRHNKTVLDEDSTNGHAFTTDTSQDLADDLDERIKQHRARLAEWKIVAKDVASRQQKENGLKIEQPVQIPASSRFSKHKALNLADHESDPVAHVPLVEPYRRLLANMGKELAPRASTKEHSATYGISQLQPRSSAIATDGKAALGDHKNVKNLRVSTTSTAPSAHKLQPSPPIDTTTGIISGNTSQQSSSPISVPSSIVDSPWIPDHDNPTATTEAENLVTTEQSGPHLATGFESPMSPTKMWMDLAERTRASMAIAGRQSIIPDPDSPIGQEAESVNSQPLPNIHSSPENSFNSTLLERTRQSMALFANSSMSNARKIRQEKRVSQVYPVNQFEGSGKSRAQEFRDSGTFTPREELLAEDAEYSSIFKSRPKLALSPAFSPDRRTSGIDGVSDQGMDGLNLNSDDGDWIA